MRRQTTPTPKPAAKPTPKPAAKPTPVPWGKAKTIDRAGRNARASQAAVAKFNADPAMSKLPDAEYKRRYIDAVLTDDTRPTPKPINPNVKPGVKKGAKK